ncbi:MAG: hypothetical protein DWQ01_06315 [Planctomycetota bacterium]|nr:MAG: hypothetical protein DWQ01_06315 [Planctomycetota bacterium]
MKPALCFLLLAALSACSTDPVRLYELREASPDTFGAQAYDQLEEAVDLANQFLHKSKYASVFPAERATFSLGFTDILVAYQGEGIEAVRMETAGWGDPRLLGSDRTHPTSHGFLTGRVTGADSTGDDSLDAAFLHMESVDMAATLLRQTAIQREIQARGEFDFWINYDLLGLWPGNGFGEENPVVERGYAVEYAFRKWLSEEHDGAVPDAPPGMMEAPPDFKPPTGKDLDSTSSTSS